MTVKCQCKAPTSVTITVLGTRVPCSFFYCSTCWERYSDAFALPECPVAIHFHPSTNKDV